MNVLECRHRMGCCEKSTRGRCNRERERGGEVNSLWGSGPLGTGFGRLKMETLHGLKKIYGEDGVMM